MGIRGLMNRLRSRPRTSANEGAAPDTDQVEALTTLLRRATLDDLSVLGGVHLHLDGTGQLDEHNRITRAMSDRLKAQGRMDATALAMRRAIIAARAAISEALDDAPMQSSTEGEHHILEAATQLAAYSVVYGELEEDSRRMLTDPYVSMWPELAHVLPGLAGDTVIPDSQSGTTSNGDLDPFVFESVDALERALNTPGLAEVAIIEGGELRDEWDLRCWSCGEEFIPFGWHEWRGTSVDFCRSCPTIAFVQLPADGREMVHFMRVLPRGALGGTTA